MIRALYTAASGMLVQFLRQQVSSANLANLNSVGYKQDTMATRESRQVPIPGDFASTLATVRLGGAPVASVGNVGGGVLAEPVVPDLRAGTLRQTNKETDLALSGPGFFSVQGPNGILYTRAGNFTRQADGGLVTADGFRVLGLNGPIALPTQEALEVKPTGDVYVNGRFVDRLLVVDVPAEAQLQQVGQNSFRVTDPNAAVVGSTSSAVAQGELESSNVDLVQTMTDVMSAMRVYESNQKVLQMEDQLLGRAVNDVGRMA